MDCGHFRYAQDTPGLTELGLGVPALEYARLGFGVIPLDRGGKRPHRMLGRDGGIYHASTSPRLITDWWTADPAANIGVATGRASQLAVVDLDVKNGNNGMAVLSSFLHEHRLDWPKGGPVAATPSGGQHCWLWWPWTDYAVPERPGILPGVDIKGDGGLVVVPPSMQLVQPLARPGDQRGAEAVPVGYRWVAGCPCQMAVVPRWMPSWMSCAPATGKHEAGGPEPDLDAGQIMETGVPVGERNRTLYRLACSLYRRQGTTGPNASWVVDQVRRAWQAGDTTGMPWREILVICESARRFIERQVANEEAAYQRYAQYLQR